MLQWSGASIEKHAIVVLKLWCDWRMPNKSWTRWMRCWDGLAAHAVPVCGLALTFFYAQCALWLLKRRIALSTNRVLLLILLLKFGVWLSVFVCNESKSCELFCKRLHNKTKSAMCVLSMMGRQVIVDWKSCDGVCGYYHNCDMIITNRDHRRVLIIRENLLYNRCRICKRHT